MTPQGDDKTAMMQQQRQHHNSNNETITTTLQWRQYQQKSTFLIPSYSILLHLIPLILGVRRE